MAVEPVDGELSTLAHLDDVAILVTHLATPFPAVRIGQWFGNKERSFVAPFLVAVPDIGDAQIKEATYSVQIWQRFKDGLRLVGSAAAVAVDNQPSIRDLNVHRSTLAVASAQNAAAEDLFKKSADRSMSATVMKSVTVNPSRGGIS